jgi:hypothetical protein
VRRAGGYRDIPARSSSILPPFVAHFTAQSLLTI